MNRAILLTLFGTLCACHSDRHDRVDTVYRGSQSTSTETPLTVAEEASAPIADRLSRTDREFIEAALLGGMFEVQSSRSAQIQQISREMLDFAQKMVDEHGRANRELETLARKHDFTPPARLDKTHQRQLDELSRLEGHEFERAYRDAQWMAHDRAFRLFESAEDDVDNAALRSFIARTLPTLREHRLDLMEMNAPKFQAR